MTLTAREQGRGFRFNLYLFVSVLTAKQQKWTERISIDYRNDLNSILEVKLNANIKKKMYNRKTNQTTCFFPW